ncbi:MAG: hypothetical protein PVG38_02160 [Gammaproteobacteria bacterium]|jgi:hypothetical protein
MKVISSPAKSSPCGRGEQRRAASRATSAVAATVAKAGALLLYCGVLVACGGGSAGGGSGGSIDPLVEDFGIAYVRQPVPETDETNLREPAAFNPGADLLYRDLASPSASERNITFGLTGGMGDVQDVEPSYDGNRLLFALRMPEIEGAAPEDQPTWNIWEYEISTGTLRRIIASDIIAEEGQDVAPHYLPDGRIIFSSTRQRTAKAVLLDEQKPQFAALDENRNEAAMVLHVMNDDGSDIHQVSFNQSHDLDPVVLQTGEVMFSRWDNMGSRDGIHLYRMYPDGTNLRLLYGAQSHDSGTGGAAVPVQFVQAREMPQGGIGVLLKPASGSFQGGDIVKVDVENYVENTQPTAANAGILTGPAQASMAFSTVRTDTAISPGGRFNAFFPLWDGTQRALVSWSQCRLLVDGRIFPCTDADLNDPDLVEAPPLYGVYMYDMSQQTQIPVFAPQEGVLYRDVVAAQPRRLPSIHFDHAGTPTAGFAFDSSLASDTAGILNIRSVYDVEGSFNQMGSTAADIGTLADPGQTTADERPARFLRIVKAVGIPDPDLLALSGADFGVSTQQLMREIIGYVPIEPDGSVRVKVPANVPLAISVLDNEGRRLTGRHQSWLQVRPGEILTCNGCHTPRTGTSHGRMGAFEGLYGGAPFDGYRFPNTETFFANAGETMAEARTRMDPGALEPSVDILYQDVWTDPAAAGRAKDAPFSYSYADLDPSLTPPASSTCQSKWDRLCRIVINYEQHIHPLWGLDRGASTCTSCHTNTDAAGVARVPAGQLDLTDGASDLNADHFKSYHELVSQDLEEIIDPVSGNLVVRDEPVFDDNGQPVYLTDADGNPVLDSLGNPIQETQTFPVAPPLRIAGAASSGRFFDRFFDPMDTVHFQHLSGAELKLIAEWIDIGGQYYNNPFDVPP